MDHKIITIKEEKDSLPELWLEVYVTGEEKYGFIDYLSRSRCTNAKTLEQADVVVFSGGSDVSAELYGEKPHFSTRPDIQQDLEDIETFKKCIKLGIPMIGVCRGAQFLSVMHGGKLNQDINNHNTSHSMYDIREKNVIKSVSSVHHQSVRDNTENGMEILADAYRSTKRWLNAVDVETSKTMDIEAFWYPHTMTLGFQGHPEYKGYFQFSEWCNRQIEEFINYNRDGELIDGKRRLSKKLRKACKFRLPKTVSKFVKENT